MNNFSTTNGEIFFIFKNCEGASFKEKQKDLLEGIMHHFDLNSDTVRDELSYKLRTSFLNNLNQKFNSVGKNKKKI